MFVYCRQVKVSLPANLKMKVRKGLNLLFLQENSLSYKSSLETTNSKDKTFLIPCIKNRVAKLTQ